MRDITAVSECVRKRGKDGKNSWSERRDLVQDEEEDGEDEGERERENKRELERREGKILDLDSLSLESERIENRWIEGSEQRKQTRGSNAFRSSLPPRE